MKNPNLENISGELAQEITAIATEENSLLKQQLFLLLEKAIKPHKRPQLAIVEQIDRRREKNGGAGWHHGRFY